MVLEMQIQFVEYPYYRELQKKGQTFYEYTFYMLYPHVSNNKNKKWYEKKILLKFKRKSKEELEQAKQHYFGDKCKLDIVLSEKQTELDKLINM